jgi:prepilin-type N-terminal cleavage/methylation domain-containing protein
MGRATSLSNRSVGRRSSGFTLLEIVAVLFVIGLASAIVIPNLPGLQSSLDFALKRESFEQAMDALAYQAFKNSEDYMLAGTYDNHGQVGKSDERKNDDVGEIPGSMRVLPIIAEKLPVPPPAAPAKFVPPLPAGWSLEVKEPIQYRASGYCTGGTLDLVIGRRIYSYRANPPLCELTLEH